MIKSMAVSMYATVDKIKLQWRERIEKRTRPEETDALSCPDWSNFLLLYI